jgi:hypothetical protein
MALGLLMDPSIDQRDGAAGRQLIAAGGHAKVSEERLGDTLVAFALK